MQEHDIRSTEQGKQLPHKMTIKNHFQTDEQFHELYPLSIATLAKRHWTPLAVAQKAARFLATNNGVRILDIGSGVGKFCLSAAYFVPGARFFGVEQRQRLVKHAENAKKALKLDNISFIHANFTQLDFRNFDNFYFYNSFYENLDGTDKIDHNIDYSRQLYHYYNRYLYRQLEQKPTGTRLATYHSLEDEIPQDYHLVDSSMNQMLKFWVKV